MRHIKNEEVLHTMKITQIRNATNRLVYAGKTFLIAPWLSRATCSLSPTYPGIPTVSLTR